MIELLLDQNIETGDAILYAIGEENVEAVEIILEHLEKIEKFNPEVSEVVNLYGKKNYRIKTGRRPSWIFVN